MESHEQPSSALAPYLDDPPPRGLFTRLARVALHLTRLQQESVAPIHMSFRDYTVLATLRREEEKGGVTVSRIAELVLRPMGSITQVVDRIEKAGLIRRRLAPGDRRKVLIELTEEGARIAELGAEIYERIHVRVLDGMAPDEVAQIDRAVCRLLAALEDDQRPRSDSPATTRDGARA